MRALSVSVTGILAILAVGLPTTPAGAATGLEPGVHVDPGSPAAKEYALPLSQARQTGTDPAGHEGPSTGGPFGAGIHPAGSGGSNPGSRARGGYARTRHTISKASPVDTPGTSAAISPVALSAASSRASSGGDGSLLTLLGGAVAVLIVGGFGGALVRRGHRSPPPA